MAELFEYIHLWENLIVEATFLSNIRKRCKIVN